MIERQIEIATKDGRMNTFICHPERAGPHPAVIFYMDAPGIREELRDMARLTKGGNAEVEIYAGVDHGFAFPLRAVYNKAAAERHWERIFELFAPLHSGA